MFIHLFSTVAVLGLSGIASAQFTLSEVFVNPPGDDQGRESIEIFGPADTQLTGFHLLVIDGDDVDAGNVDHAIDLGGYTTGSNGLLLIRDAATALNPPPDPATSVVVFDPTPNIENGTSTFVLGTGTAPAVDTDLDADDDGALDSGIPGFTALDTVAFTDRDEDDRMYADELGGTEIDNDTFTPDALYRIYDETGEPFCWTDADVIAAEPAGPFAFDFDGGEFEGGLAEDHGPQELDLGRLNDRITLCSEGYGIDAADGGDQELTVDAGAAHAGMVYLFLGSVSGTDPGIQLTPTVTLPLNPDAYLEALLVYHNTLLNPSLGLLDSEGRATATLTLPPGLDGLGIEEIHHAVVVYDPATRTFRFASTPSIVFLH